MTLDKNNPLSNESVKSDSVCEAGLSFTQIKELMTHMKKEGVTTFEIGEGSNHLLMSREHDIRYGEVGFTPYQAAGQAFSVTNIADATDEEVAETVSSGHVVTSPVVGVFYDSPSPDQEPYVEIGSYVKKGDVLCIVEAMKLMNEVTSPINGMVKEIMVKKASRVEYGQKLFVIDPAQTGE